ncbi:ribose 5-phosphate isomerase B [Candidatus Finniella inopinata]|uniref:Ribose 5-phosphate isomerase B n=1 Tax=Candidatus Finniella inopinata TaxID=1696036 RepID=A0A4Q7DEY8_9PROT|nr:ribose 5-phosphate isomerase B [Candidatus Finniella inopinata]RZI45202.1 ribose 5-phosphate isomerase B [Candidatus Finniella inopinata]
MSEVIGSTSVIVFGCDHAGFLLQQHLMEKVKAHGFHVIDCGTDDELSVDYPDFAERVAERILHQKAEKGILICGTGMGMAIAANRHRGIRAACCYDANQATIARQHNDINVLCLGSRLSDEAVAFECVMAFLKTDFDGGRHQRRLDKIDKNAA